jgi:predicted Fe-Mo cluster-binding NifX family protein
MRIAISSVGDTLDAPVDPRFERAAKFILLDTETGGIEVRDNAPSLSSPHAGIQAAETVFGLCAQAVITGHCEPSASRALRASDIQVITGARGTVAEAVAAFRAGTLTPVESADLEA